MGEYKGIMGGVTSMVASRFTPWHYSYNQDRVKLTDLTIESGHQALTMAGIDWHVNKLSLAEFMPGFEGADDFCAMLRSDKSALLGIGSSSYTVIDNPVVGDLTDAVLIAVPGSNVISAGALYDPGKVVWTLVELPQGQANTFGGREHHERYVLISTSHDSSLPLTIRGTRVRVECMNTMSMAWRGSKAEYVVRHTTNALDYVEEARRAIGVEAANWQAWDEQISKLIDTELEEMEFAVDFVPAVIGDRPEDAGRAQTMWDAKFDDIVGIYQADHNEAITDTAWGAVNAINEHEEWGVTPRGQKQHERQMAMMLRGDYPLTRKALALATN